jgi:hypothetical protein
MVTGIAGMNVDRLSSLLNAVNRKFAGLGKFFRDRLGSRAGEK